MNLIFCQDLDSEPLYHPCFSPDCLHAEQNTCT